MKLTEFEKQTIQQGEFVQFQEGDVKCVVVRADLFERFRGLLTESLPPEVITTLVDDTMSDYDANDPLLDTYQKYKQ